MFSVQVGLLLLFVYCGLVYGRASKELVRLDKLRLEKEPPPLPDNMVGAATEFARRIGITLAPGGSELKGFCERNGLGPDYQRHNRRLYASILVALLCAYLIIKLSSGQSMVP